MHHVLLLQAHVDTAETREAPSPVFVTEWLLSYLAGDAAAATDITRVHKKVSLALWQQSKLTAEDLYLQNISCSASS
jgi:hypothetical protein